MSETSETNGARPKPDVAALRAEIKQTRADLGETVQVLAARADVKARAREQVEATRQRVLAQAAETTGRVREAAANATGLLRSRAVQAASGVRDTAGGATEKVAGSVPLSRREVLPLALVGAVAVAGVILIVRGRRR